MIYMLSVIKVLCPIQVLLCTKEVNEKARILSLKLLVNLGHAAQRCFQKSAEGVYL